MNPVQLAVRVLRFDSRTRLSAVLTAMGVTVATALVLILSTLPDAAQARAERSAWQFGQDEPGVSKTGAVALATQDFVRNEPITRLDVSGESDGLRGAPEFPGAGEVLLSPVLAAKAEQMPHDQLADRFPGEVVRILGEEHLRFPEQLVAVVAHPKGELDAATVNRTMSSVELSAVRQDTVLHDLGWFGLVILAVPSLVLVASASRLTAARRERRLATLQLAGATPSQVVATVAAEVGIAAVGGTALGLVLSWPLRSLMATVPWGGGTWLVSDFTPSALVVLVSAIGIPALVVAASVLALRRVVRTPLSAATEQQRSRPRAWRLLLIFVVGGLFLYGLSRFDEGAGIAMLLVALAAIVWSFSLIGPWITATIGWVFAKVWRRPATLLAGRRLASDPKAAYRSASGVVLAVFLGSLALTALPIAESGDLGGRSFKDEVIYADVPSSQAPTGERNLAQELERAGVRAGATRAERVWLQGPEHGYHLGLIINCERAREVTLLEVGACEGPPGLRASPSEKLPSSGLEIVPQVSGRSSAKDPPGVPVPGGIPVHPLNGRVTGPVLVDPEVVPPLAGTGESTLAVLPPGDGDREKVRTALARVVPGSDIESHEPRIHDQQVYVDDLRRVTAIGLAVAGILAGCSSAITAAGSVLDRRRPLGALIAAGTPIRVLTRSLRTEAALPALVATLGAAAAGIAVGAGLLTLFDEQAGVPLNPWILAPVGLGLLVAAIAASASGPTLHRISTEPLADD